MSNNSKVNRAYQHSQRNKTQDSEYVRYVDSCDGRPFNDNALNQWFDSHVKNCYDTTPDVTVLTIISNPGVLQSISETIVDYMNREEVYANKFRDVTKEDERGFSFCNYVAKRLVLLRKAGKLVRKKMPNRKVRENKRKKRVNNAVGGSLVRKVE